jgi:hypothetical protein
MGNDSRKKRRALRAERGGATILRRVFAVDPLQKQRRMISDALYNCSAGASHLIACSPRGCCDVVRLVRRRRHRDNVAPSLTWRWPQRSLADPPSIARQLSTQPRRSRIVSSRLLR